MLRSHFGSRVAQVSPSITAALGENGPCSVMEDSKSTTLNPWSWNDQVNMLYIEQPVQVGFSFNTLVNGTLNGIPTPFLFQPQNFTVSGIPETNLTFLTGTFATPNIVKAPNTTVAAAPAMWNFMQTWIQGFPKYGPNGDKFSIWSESYRGHYAPVYSDFFEKQNDLIAAGNSNTSAIQLHIDTIGLINACIDIDMQVASYPEFAFSNTYGVKAINESQYRSAVANTSTCLNLIGICRRTADEQDPQGVGNIAEVNEACLNAYLYCFSKMHDGYDPEWYQFDLLAPALGSLIHPKWAAGYLNTADVQQALGVPLNFTGNSGVDASGFNLTGDFVRGHGLANLGTLLDKGVKVALVYRDRDYQCNWPGGEAISKAIKSKTAAIFAKAGYAKIQMNSSYVGASFVKQEICLSFSRVFQAGHEVPYYQPETAYQIFNRVMFNTDVARGKNPSANYSTKGPSSAFTKSEVNAQPGQSPCYLWDILETCTKSQKQILQNGTAIVENFIPVGQKQANGSTVFYNGTSGGGNGARSNSSGAGTTFSSVASPMAPFRAMNTTVLSAAALVVLQTTFF